MKRCLVILMLAATMPFAPAAGAQDVKFGSESRPLMSDNVTPLTTLPVGKPIGARFRDGYMYVTGVDGLTIYDVSDPANPALTGVLPLPHFQNEDVDLGGDILLISNDPNEGVGLLYVIDISDPTSPEVKSVLPNGVHDGTAGDIAGIFGVELPEPLSPVGKGGIGHTASCVTADCTWAYLGGTSKGIQIVDLRNPAEPKPAGRFVPDITGLASHDVQIDGNGLAWIVGNSGTAAYDVSDPADPKAVMRSDESVTWSGEALPGIRNDYFDFPKETMGLVGYGEGAIDLVHHNSMRLGTVLRTPPGTTPPPDPGGGGQQGGGEQGGGGGGGGQQGGSEQGGSGQQHSDGGQQAPPGSTTITVGGSGAPVVSPAEEAAKRRTKAQIRRCKAKKSKKARKRCLRKARRNQRGRATARAAASGGGSLVLEPFVQKPGKAYPAGGDSPMIGVVEEDYNRPTCEGAGSFQVWGVTDQKTSKGATKLGLLDMYTTELEKLVNDQSGWAPVAGLCSAHYFDYRDGIVAGGWYEEGTRFLDVTDPTNVRQVGYWVPTKGETWSVVFPPTDPTGSIVYALDFARGIDVLRLDRGDLRERKAPVRRSWLVGKGSNGLTSRTGLTTRSRFGFVCRLPA